MVYTIILILTKKLKTKKTQINVLLTIFFTVTSYNWIVSGGTIISGQGEKEITALAGSNPGTHFDKWVRAENTCRVSDYYGEYGYIEDCGGGEFIVIPI